jgi:prephenate dehydrogenase
MGLALREAAWEGLELVGYARRPEAASQALRLRVVDRAERNLAAAVEKADLAIIATPPAAVPEILDQIAAHLPSRCVVSDTASTKAQILEWAAQHLPPTVSFVGGHPMAGRELWGMGAAQAGLFHDCTYCLVPAPNATPEAIQLVTKMVEAIGARPCLLSAEEHDHLVAGVSHLPLLLSAALVATTTESSSWPQLAELAATGYRDLTRLASGNPQMSRDICLTNQAAITVWVDRFIRELHQFRRLAAEGGGELERAFARARQAREDWLRGARTGGVDHG